MGFIQAFKGALSQTFADEWKDFYLPQSNVPATAAIFRAVPKGTNNGVGENTKGAENIITNGSKIVVPEGTALVTFQDGAITGFITEPGGYEFKSDDPNSKSFFSGDGILASTIKESWERFKFGGIPSTQQLAFYVNLKEIPNNKFGTQEKIRFFDAYLNAQVAVLARGSYTLKIIDPILFVKNFVPQKYLQSNAPIFDFADMDNDAGTQLFNEVIGCLQPALSNYSNDESKQNSIIKIQGDQLGFAKVLSAVVESEYGWKSSRGLEIIKVAMTGLDYDEKTQELVDKVAEKRADISVEMLRGQAYSQNMQGMMAGAVGHSMQTQAEGWKAAGEGIKAAGEAGSLENVGSGMFMGMGMQNQPQGADALNAVNNMSQTTKEDPTEKLLNAKKLLDAGAITQEDYDKIKSQVLGI